MRIKSVVGCCAVVALVFAGGACGKDKPSDAKGASSAAAAAEAVDVRLGDAGTSVSGPVRPGGTLRVRNDGAQMHMMRLARLHKGRTIADATKALQSDDESAMDKVADKVGAPSSQVPPGQMVEVSTADLTAGHYIVADFYPKEGGDGTPNVFATGLGELVVSGSAVTAPVGDVSYAVTAGKPVTGPVQLAAGRHVMTFNGLSDGKEISIFRLQKGDTVGAISSRLFNIFDANDGKGLTVAGAGRSVAQLALFWVSPPDRGGALILGVSLTPGTYALVVSDVDADDASKAPIAEQLTLTVK